MKNLDEKFMRAALKEAEKARAIDEVPVGAVLVKDNKIVARAFNLRETKLDPTCHAEVLAIKKACKKEKSWRLEGFSLYVTIEPCPMCAGTILASRISRVVYGAKDPKGGSLGSSFNLFEVPNINHHPEVLGGVLEEECSKIIKDYFKNKRLK